MAGSCDSGFSVGSFLVRFAVASVLVAAAILKAMEPNLTALAIRHLLPSTIPSVPWAYAVLGSVVAAEFIAGLGLLLWPKSRFVLALVILLMLIFSGALVLLALDPAAPACGCINIGQWQDRGRQEALWGLLRNAVIIISCLWCLASLPSFTARTTSKAPTT